MGEYALKGVRLSIGRGNLVIIENRLSSPSDPYLLTYNTDKLVGIKLYNGEVLNADPVEEYFIQKYPESA